MLPDPETAPDEELLERAAGGDQDAFATLMRRHEDRVFALALRMTGNRHDALDATQDAFVSAYRRAGTFRRDAAFSTWLYRIAINACHDLLRKRTRAETSELVDRASELNVAERAGARLDVSRALAQLSDEYREAIVLCDLMGVSYEEVAALTGVALGTVKSRISRGRRRLAELLEPTGASGSSKGQT